MKLRGCPRIPRIKITLRNKKHWGMSAFHEISWHLKSACLGGLHQFQAPGVWNHIKPKPHINIFQDPMKYPLASSFKQPKTSRILSLGKVTTCFTTCCNYLSQLEGLVPTVLGFPSACVLSMSVSVVCT